jgi:hypothetical protein
LDDSTDAFSWSRSQFGDQQLECLVVAVDPGMSGSVEQGERITRARR